MAGDETENFIRIKTAYSFNEIIQYMKKKDKQPTKTQETIQWVNVKSGEVVVIGYTD